MKKALVSILMFAMFLIAMPTMSTAEKAEGIGLSTETMLHLASLDMNQYLKEIDEMGLTFGEMESELTTRFSFGFGEYADVMLYAVYTQTFDMLKERGVFNLVEKRQSSVNVDSLSAYSYEDLVSLKEQINLAMWKSKEWQEVTVPQGTWKVGEDIPAGTWVVKCADMGRTNYLLRYCDMQWGESLNESGRYVNWHGRYDTNINIYNPNHQDYEEGQMTEYILTVQDGDYIIISGMYNQAVFTPYTGKPSLGFK